MSELKALFASTRRTASVLESCTLHVQLLHSLHPDLHIAVEGQLHPPHQLPTTFRMALAMILRGTSPMPIGLTPRHLSSGTKRQATNALIPSGLTSLVARRQPTQASAAHRAEEADLKEEQSLLHACASNPDGPAAPLVCRVVCFIMSASRLSKMIGLTGVRSPPARREETCGSLHIRCFF